jgi:hypothetical protein
MFEQHYVVVVLQTKHPHLTIAAIPKRVSDKKRQESFIDFCTKVIVG